MAGHESLKRVVVIFSDRHFSVPILCPSRVVLANTTNRWLLCGALSAFAGMRNASLSVALRPRPSDSIPIAPPPTRWLSTTGFLAYRSRRAVLRHLSTTVRRVRQAKNPLHYVKLSIRVGMRPTPLRVHRRKAVSKTGPTTGNRPQFPMAKKPMRRYQTGVSRSVSSMRP